MSPSLADKSFQSVLDEQRAGNDPSYRGLYILGCVDRRVTFRAQQDRALNLVAALFTRHKVRAGSRIVIVGGGLAGLTAALAAARSSADVTLLEREGQMMPLQLHSDRYVHPGIYDWPDARWNEDASALPFLNWRADEAKRVRQEILNQWTREYQNLGIEAYNNAQVHTVKPDARAWQVRWLDDTGVERASIGELAILAVGFGEEVGFADPRFSSPTYWEVDNEEKKMQGGGTAVVSGCGDGGLTDVLRLALSNFEHKSLVSYAGDSRIEDVRVKILHAESHHDEFADGEELTNFYLNLDVPRAFDSEIIKQVNKKTKIYLVGRSQYPFSRNSCAINRFMVSRLMKSGHVEYVQALFDDCNVNIHNGRTIVALPSIELQDVRVVLKRHGPRPALPTIIPDVWEKLADRRKYYAASPWVSDETRRPFWNDFGYFEFMAPIISDIHVEGHLSWNASRWWLDPRYQFAAKIGAGGLERLAKTIPGIKCACIIGPEADLLSDWGALITAKGAHVRTIDSTALNAEYHLAFADLWRVCQLIVVDSRVDERTLGAIQSSCSSERILLTDKSDNLDLRAEPRLSEEAARNAQTDLVAAVVLGAFVEVAKVVAYDQATEILMSLPLQLGRRGAESSIRLACILRVVREIDLEGRPYLKCGTISPHKITKMNRTHLVEVGNELERLRSAIASYRHAAAVAEATSD